MKLTDEEIIKPEAIDPLVSITVNTTLNTLKNAVRIIELSNKKEIQPLKEHGLTILKTMIESVQLKEAIFQEIKIVGIEGSFADVDDVEKLLSSTEGNT